jgi:hypothetical protein
LALVLLEELHCGVEAVALADRLPFMGVGGKVKEL